MRTPGGRPRWLRTHLAGLRALLVLTVVLGVGYPLLITVVAMAGFAGQRAGSLLHYRGQVVGSALIGQRFSDAHGTPLPQWFQPRPSAAGSGYQPLASGASNLGPSSVRLLKAVDRRRATVAAFNSVPGHRVSKAQVPPDAVTASGSGLDPDISPTYAYLQVYRVAAARHLDPAVVRRLVAVHVQGRPLGVLGEPRVNVLVLNLALARLGGR